jgi:hypothetical protein
MTSLLMISIIVGGVFGFSNHPSFGFAPRRQP